jgi:hypothetical protein
MEIVKSRYGLDRVIEKLNHDTLRITGESEFVRTSVNKEKLTSMFDFEGGPCLSIGGKLMYGNMNWKIVEINTDVPQYKGLTTCNVKVLPIM